MFNFWFIKSSIECSSLNGLLFLLKHSFNSNLVKSMVNSISEFCGNVKCSTSFGLFSTKSMSLWIRFLIFISILNSDSLHENKIVVLLQYSIFLIKSFYFKSTILVIEANNSWLNRMVNCFFNVWQRFCSLPCLFVNLISMKQLTSLFSELIKLSAKYLVVSTLRR